MGEGYAPSAAVELPSKMVQEIADSGYAVPEKYIHKEVSSIDPESLPWMPSDVLIDLQQLLLDSPSELHKFRSALLSWRCFQVVNHGMTSSFLDEVREITKQFFALPSEEKQKYMRPVDDFEGYGNDTFVSKDRVLDWTDRLYLLSYPEDRRRLKFWPEEPPSLREVLGEFSIKSQAVLKAVIKAMERSLDLKEGSIGDQYGEKGMIFSRFNFYPRCPLPDQVLGIIPHTDGSALTILLQNKEVEGLQVLKDDQWFKVPVIPDALFINAGDQCEIMSNGMFKSPVHRVVTNSERERVSVAMFCTPDPENEIGPAAELINDGQPQLYRNVKNYPTIFYHYYQLGESPLASVKIQG
ncbi:hypothetical protein Droror1_Dr00004467 [Drosera rotundifolia]